MEDQKPAFTKSYGEAKEANMNPKEQETKPKSVQGDPLNNSKESKEGLTRREFLKKAGTTALGVAAGLVFPGALKNTRADAPVVEAPLPDASPEPVYTHRSYSPFTPFEAERPETKDITPLWPDKIGEFAPYNFEIVNMGRKAGVEVMDQELFNNLVMKMREWAIAPEVPRRVVVYGDYIQLNNESAIRRPDPPLVRTNSGNTLLGPQELRLAKLSDGSLQMDVSIPTIKDPSRLDEWSLYAGIAVTSEIFSFLFSDKDGNYQSRDRFNLNYKRDGEYPVYKRDENSTIISAPLLVRYINP